jgi:hypothetical protein
MLWIMDPASVGKPAVTQMITEEMKVRGRFREALFSRPDRREDPERVMLTSLLSSLSDLGSATRSSISGLPTTQNSLRRLDDIWLSV